MTTATIIQKKSVLEIVKQEESIFIGVGLDYFTIESEHLQQVIDALEKMKPKPTQQQLDYGC